MDVHPRLESSTIEDVSTGQPVKKNQPKVAKKRNFDVAFLMAPDEPKNEGKISRRNHKTSPAEVSIANRESPIAEDCAYEVKSAFTKVRPCISPVSPASSGSGKSCFSPDSAAYHDYNQFVPITSVGYVPPSRNPYLAALLKREDAQQNKIMSKTTGMFFDQSYGFSPFTPLQQPPPVVFPPILPPSLAALTLPAQNVCAKCNMNFRMTSDLVYHMRSHHKNEHSAGDSYKKRREQDKLRCPVCNESFRERHHLTRHMTAHQDKAGDSDMIGGGADIMRMVPGFTK